MGHNGCYHPYTRAIGKSFFRSKKPAENPTNGITNSTILHPFMRDPIDRLYSLFNLANPALSKPLLLLCQLGPMQEERRIIVVRH